MHFGLFERLRWLCFLAVRPDSFNMERRGRTANSEECLACKSDWLLSSCVNTGKFTRLARCDSLPLTATSVGRVSNVSVAYRAFFQDFGSCFTLNFWLLWQAVAPAVKKVVAPAVKKVAPAVKKVAAPVKKAVPAAIKKVSSPDSVLRSFIFTQRKYITTGPRN